MNACLVCSSAREPTTAPHFAARASNHRRGEARRASKALALDLPRQVGARAAARTRAARIGYTFARHACRCRPRVPTSPMSIPATLIPGDGIGPEIVESAIKVLEALGGPFSWDRQIAGLEGVRQAGDPLPAATLESIRRTRLALKGP